MGQLLLLLVVALTVAAVVFGVTVLVTGSDPGLAPAEPDGRAVPLPGTRPLVEGDIAELRFDTSLRGYRMAQVDQAIGRAAYDIGYKDELIGVLEAEVTALREGRTAEADVLRRAREAALAPVGQKAGGTGAPELLPAEPAPADEATPTAAAAAATAPAAAAPDAAPDRAPAASDPEPTAGHLLPTAGERGEPLPPPPAGAGPGGEPGDQRFPPAPPATNGTTVSPLPRGAGAEPAIDEGGIDSVTRAETPEDGRVTRPDADTTKDGAAERSAATPTADARAERP